MSRRQYRKPRRSTFAEIRKAALRRWRIDDTPGKIAARLDQPTEYVHRAITPDVRSVMKAYSVGQTAPAIADELSLPVNFVNYVIRRINAVDVAQKRRARSRERVRGRDPMAPEKRHQGQVPLGAGGVGSDRCSLPEPSGAGP